MQLIQKIFKKKKDIPLTSEQKLSMLDEQSSSSLEAIAKGENGQFNELKLRLVAIKKLPYSQTLCSLAFQSDSHSDINREARLCIAKHLDSDAISSTTLKNDFKDPEQVLLIASLSKSDDLQHQVLTEIESEDVLGKICMASSSAAVRYSLAERIERQDILREIADRLKNKDKKSYKLVKAKLDRFKIEEKSLNEKRSKIDTLCQEVELHIDRHIDHQYKLEVDRLKRRWEECENDASVEQKSKFVGAIAKCDARLDEVKDALAAQERELMQKAEAEKQYGNLIEQLDLFVATNVSAKGWLDELSKEQQEKLRRIQSEWNELRDVTPATLALEKSFSKKVNICEKLIEEYSLAGTLVQQTQSLQSSGVSATVNSDDTGPDSLVADASPVDSSPVDSSPAINSENQSVSHEKNPASYSSLKRLLSVFDASHSSLPELVIARDTITACDRLVVAEKEDQKRQLGAVGGLIRKSSSAVEQGRLKQAIGIRHSITTKLAGLGKAAPEHLLKKIETLDEDIQKLIDWQAYAVIPKKEALIESMTKLVGIDLLPEALAAKIKKLQGEWRELKQNGLDKRGEDQKDVLWESFKTQADLAYEPCREYFQELSNTRKENLDKRKALVQQLQDFDTQYDWENADWKTVEKVIRTARSELHGYVPVDRSENKLVLEDFDKIMDQIQSKLNGEREKNKAAKEQLIMQADKLADIGEIQQAIDAAKRLQSQWKKIGPCHYRDSDALWKSFRAACDVVFERKSKQDSEQRSQDSEKISQANDLIARLKSLSEKLPEHLSVVNTEKQSISDDFYALEDLPERAHGSLRREFSKASEQVESDIKSTLRKNEEQSWQGLFNVLRLSNAYRFAVKNNEPGEDESLSQFNQAADELAIWPEGTQSVVRSTVTQSSLDKSSDVESATDELRTLCVRAEIATDKESPSEDRSLRMEYQVRMLQKGLGRTSNDNTRPLLIRDWILSPAVSADEYASLFDRFKTSWSELS